uniref:Uncharacterized protein n=1 Tax=Oryza nivara TaxID=4536 RepID=A0A0E0IJK5_ORYNI
MGGSESLLCLDHPNSLRFAGMRGSLTSCRKLDLIRDVQHDLTFCPAIAAKCVLLLLHFQSADLDLQRIPQS